MQPKPVATFALTPGLPRPDELAREGFLTCPNEFCGYGLCRPCQQAQQMHSGQPMHSALTIHTLCMHAVSYTGDDTALYGSPLPPHTGDA